jgi:SAM-dependent methyltransferase
MYPDYVHGHSNREWRRLEDQASTLTELLHWDSVFEPGTHVLEAGCGVGSQTAILARTNPGTIFTAVDVSRASIEEALRKMPAGIFPNVRFQVGDIFDLPFANDHFDHLFACFLLEHLREPVRALRSLGRVLKPGGTISVIEGDHGSAYFHPDSREANLAIKCQVELQAEAGGNAMIGRQLFPLLALAGYEEVAVTPRQVYADARRPQYVEGFTKKTFTAMIEGVREAALQRGIIDRETFDKGIRDLLRTAEPDGTFCYTFFKASGIKPYDLPA